MFVRSRTLKSRVVGFYSVVDLNSYWLPAVVATELGPVMSPVQCIMGLCEQSNLLLVQEITKNLWTLDGQISWQLV